MPEAVLSTGSSGGLTVRWRTLEWWGCGIALMFQSGAVFPLLLSLTDGGLDESAKAKLRLMALPAYFVAMVLLVRHRRMLLVALRRNFVFGALLVMPLVSILWSISPSVSLRRAVALVLSVALSYALALRFSPRQLLALFGAVLIPSMIASLTLALLVPQIGMSPWEATMRGIYTNKNVLGWNSCVAVLVSVMMLRERLVGRGVGVLLVIPPVACLVGSTSMTAIVATAFAMAVIPVHACLARLRGTSRLLAGLVALQVVALLVLSLTELLVPTLEMLGKDATLTGRVPLWHLVDEAIRQRPILGYGYKAFWTDGNPAVWRIWGETGWQPPHSHNGFRELMLDLGLVGLMPFLFVSAAAVIGGSRLHCRSPREGWLWLNVVVAMFLVMNLTECLIMEQNDFHFILFSTAVIMFGLGSRERRGAQPVGPGYPAGAMALAGRFDLPPQSTKSARV